MMCHRIGRPPISTSGFGRTPLSSAIRVSETACENHGLHERISGWSAGTVAGGIRGADPRESCLGDDVELSDGQLVFVPTLTALPRSTSISPSVRLPGGTRLRSQAAPRQGDATITREESITAHSDYVVAGNDVVNPARPFGASSRSVSRGSLPGCRCRMSGDRDLVHLDATLNHPFQRVLTEHPLATSFTNRATELGVGDDRAQRCDRPARSAVGTR